MANELYLVTWGEFGERNRLVVSAKSESWLESTYSWMTHDDVDVRCIGVALPDEPIGVLCVDIRVSTRDGAQSYTEVC